MYHFSVFNAVTNKLNIIIYLLTLSCARYSPERLFLIESWQTFIKRFQENFWKSEVHLKAFKFKYEHEMKQFSIFYSTIFFCTPYVMLRKTASWQKLWRKCTKCGKHFNWFNLIMQTVQSWAFIVLGSFAFFDTHKTR